MTGDDEDVVRTRNGRDTVGVYVGPVVGVAVGGAVATADGIGEEAGLGVCEGRNVQ